MRVAFYAPLKSPSHPVPSGDRLIARAFIAALQRAGHEVELASRLRTWDREGSEARQRRIDRIGAHLAARLVRRFARMPSRRPDVWFTYHVYHKAPDVIGPRVCDALQIPYVVAEASVARKQREGPWHLGHASAIAAIQRADAVLCINPVDLRGVTSIRGDRGVVPLAPFLDVVDFVKSPTHRQERSAPPRLVVAAMMRRGNKLASFRLLAEALARIEPLDWTLTIIGDGEAAGDVRSAFARFPATRVAFAGSIPHESMAGTLVDADVFVWPAIDEVIGMTLLEAQACGVPVVAGRGPGVASVVKDGNGGVLVAQGDGDAFAAGVASLLQDSARRRAMGEQGREYVREHHDIAAAARAIDAVLHAVVAKRTP